MSGGMWRWAWTAGVFGLFFVVVGAALDGMPAADGEPPLITPGDTPIKERVALPDLDEVVPRSSVLNLLADGDEVETTAPAALDALARELAARDARESEVARVEATLDPSAPGAAASAEEAGGEPGASGEAAAGAPAAEVPFAAVPEPDRRPPRPAAAAAPAPAEMAARVVGDEFRIQLAAVPPGEEHATFERLERRFAGVLAGLAPRFQAISTDGGVLVRVQAAGFASEAAATARCERIRAAGGDCFVVGGAG